MVLLVPCYSAALSSGLSSPLSPSFSSDNLFYEVPSSLRPAYTCELRPAEPIPLAKKHDESPLSTSSDSISSFRSNCSMRSATERAIERESRRRLLDISVGKIHSVRDIPLRKHLHVYSTIKALQRDLELLDDEELYCSLTDTAMEVDEWPGRKNGPIQPPHKLDNIQDAFDGGEAEMKWTSSSPRMAAAGNGSSLDDEPGVWTGPSLWAHLDDLSANPLGHSWLSSGELSSLFAPHLVPNHPTGDALCMRA